MAGRLKINQVNTSFADQYGRPIAVYEVSGRMGFHAFVYQCILNLDRDGAPKTYGYDNPAVKNSAGGPNLQKNLDPLENWHKGAPGLTAAQSEKAGLGNACGDPGDGTKGHVNFQLKNRNFYWAGIMSLQRREYRARLNALPKNNTSGLGYTLDDRDELEAGRETVNAPMKPQGEGYFPLVQDSGASAGYYISTSSGIADGSASVYSPSRYLDSTKVPYAVRADAWSNVAGFGGRKVNQGDFGIAILPKVGTHTGYVYGETGTPDRVGECSPALHAALGLSTELVAFIAFPGSGNGKVLGPNPENQIQPNVRRVSASLGADAVDLAAFLATGQANPNARMSSPAARMFTKIYAALADWTPVTMEPSESYDSRPQRPRYL
jgi:hypothetical protein